MVFHDSSAQAGDLIGSVLAQFMNVGSDCSAESIDAVIRSGLLGADFPQELQDQVIGRVGHWFSLVLIF